MTDDDRADPANRATADQPGAGLMRDWITLWQSEFTAMAADRELQEGWQTQVTRWADAATAAFVPRRATDAPGHAGASASPRATATDAAPDARDAELERLRLRVAELERRLGELEDPARRPDTRPRLRRAGGPAKRR